MRRSCARTHASDAHVYVWPCFCWCLTGLRLRAALYVVGWRVLSGERRTEREKEDRWKVSSVQGRGSSTLVAPPHRRKPNKPTLKTTQITRIGDRTLQRNRTVIRFRTVRLDWIRLVAPLHLPRGRRNNPIAIIWSTSQRRCCPPCGWGTCACRAMARKTVSRKRKAEEPKEQQVNNKSLYTEQKQLAAIC